MTLSIERFDFIQPDSTWQLTVAVPNTPPPMLFPTVKFIFALSFKVWPKGSFWIKFKSAFTSTSEMITRSKWHSKQLFQFFSPFGKL